MTAEKHAVSEGPSLLDVVALLADVPGEGLARGKSARSWNSSTTKLCSWSSVTIKVVAPCPRAELLVLHYVSVAA